mgnify:CR=1 FL=1
MRKLLALVLPLLVLTGLRAQTIENINLLQTRGLHGTARFTGMGGAFTALGNDFSALHLNPAGAAVFRSDNIGFTLGFQSQRDETNFLGGQNRDSNFKLLWENGGFVKNFGTRSQPVYFSITLNKTADFKSRFSAQGINRYNANPESGFTIGEYWLAGVQDLSISQMESFGFFEEASAADATVLLVDSIGAFTYDYWPDDASNVRYIYEERGNADELQFSLASRQSDKFYYGVSVAMPYLNYFNRTGLEESGYADSSFFDRVRLNRFNEVNGTGLNLKAGFIAKPVQWFRVGASYQSPTWYWVNEVYSLSVDGFSGGTSYRGTEYIFDNIRYTVRVPSIYRAGVAFVIAKSAVLSVDYEFSDPSRTTLNSRDGNNYLGAENDYTEAVAATNTLRAGLEYRLGEVYLRGGYQFAESNFIDKDFYQSDREHFSLGAGYKNRDFSLDIAYTWINFNQSFVAHPYLGDNLTGEGVVNPERTLVRDDVWKGNIIIGASFNF